MGAVLPHLEVGVQCVAADEIGFFGEAMAGWDLGIETQDLLP